MRTQPSSIWCRSELISGKEKWDYVITKKPEEVTCEACKAALVEAQLKERRDDTWRMCQSCDGTGNDNGHPCPPCGGLGMVPP